MFLTLLSAFRKPFALLCAIAVLFGLPLTCAGAGEGYDAKISAARSAWLRDSSRISKLLDDLRGHATGCNRLDKDIADTRDEIRRLEEELARKLAEMAEGRFCSKCGSSASEIERREPFLYHIQSVNGIVLPASPEQLEAARQSGREGIAKVKQKLAKLEDQKKSALNALNQALHELTVTIDQYHRDIRQEQTLQIARWGADSVDWHEKLTALQDQLNAVEKQPRHAGTDVQLRALEAQLKSSLNATSAAESRARQTATTFGQATQRDMESLARKAETIPSGQPLLDGWHIGKRITSQNFSYSAYPVARPQGSTAAHQLRGPAKPAPSSAPAKSAADLLKGK